MTKWPIRSGPHGKLAEILLVSHVMACLWIRYILPEMIQGFYDMKCAYLHIYIFFAIIIHEDMLRLLLKGIIAKELGFLQNYFSVIFLHFLGNFQWIFKFILLTTSLLSFHVQGVPPISTHFWFQFLTFLMVLSKKSNLAILTQMV